MFYSCLVLSFDTCIVTITWSPCLLLLLCGLSIRLGRLLSLLVARVLYQHWCVSLSFIDWRGNIWLYSRTWCSGSNPSVKLHALHGSEVPTGVIVLLGFVSHHAEVMASQPNLSCCIPLCGLLAVI
jgi:hypothetical protein